MTTKCTTDHITKTFSLSFAIICLIVKYNSFYVKSDTVKSLMEQLQRIYDNLKDNNEIAIIDRYGDIAKRYTTTLTITIASGLFVIIGAQLYPYFINIVSSANESQPRQIPMQLPVEYFVDQEKYFFLLLFHLNATMCISLSALIAIGTMLIAFLQHACGILKVASYRIKNTIQIYIQSLNQKDKNLICNNLIYAINIHRNAVMFSECLISEFEITFMLLIVFGIMSLSLNTFRIFSSEYSIEELPLTFLLTSILFMYMFLANFIGQEIIDHYGLIFAATYEIQWYITPLYIQKLILFLLLRGNKSFGLNVGGLFISSLECFATLANATLSYVIVMYSTIQ